MPIYEYECPACGKFEKEQRITAPALETCETCGKPVRKLISATSFALKGSGWYADGYGSNKKNGSSASAPSEPKAEAKSGGGCGAEACATACAGPSSAVS